MAYLWGNYEIFSAHKLGHLEKTNAMEEKEPCIRNQKNWILPANDLEQVMLLLRAPFSSFQKLKGAIHKNTHLIEWL